MGGAIQSLCEIIILVMTILMNITRKNVTVVALYTIQSLALVLLLGTEAYQQHDIQLFLLVVSIFIIKVLVAPTVFLGFIHRTREHLATEAYLSTPLTLAVLTVLAIFVQSGILSTAFVGVSTAALLLVDSLLMSFFIAVNRTGILLQIIGVLSLENSVFALGHLLDPHMSADLELGILFDVLFWIVIASVFVRMVYRHHSSLDVANLRELKQ